MRRLCSLGLFLLLPLSVHATKPQHAVFDSYEDLAAGKCLSVSLSEDGVLTAGPAVEKRADLGVPEAWSVLAQPDGSIVVGTAPEGKLLRVGSDGTVKTLAKFDESHLYALARGPRGSVYVGTSPDGKIYQVDAAGKVEVYFEPKEKYIWALVVASDGTLYAGTGTKGKIYRITGKGQGEVWYASNETHIRALALDKNGALLAGTSDSGYLLRVKDKDQATVLAGTDKEEVNQIRVADDGSIYFAATGKPKALPTGSAKPDKPAPPAPAGDLGGGMQLRDLLMTDGVKGSVGMPVLSHSSEGVSALYCLDQTLYPQSLWQSKETILSLAWDEAHALAWVGTGNDGYTYCVTPHGEAIRLCKIDSDSVTAMTMIGKDIVLAASNPARLFRLGSAKSSPGIYESDVIDAQSFAKWGAVTVGASDPGSVKVLTRSGNTSKPDKTWYPWTETNHLQSQTPAARYEQVQLQIMAGTVDQIDAAYQARNQPPHIDAVKVLPVGTGYEAIQSPLPPPSPRGADQLLGAPDKSDGDALSLTRWQEKNATGLRTVVWKASDPNGDDLTYAVFWRKKGDGKWRALGEKLTDRVLSWDTSGWADGVYELKVTANDADANAEGEGLQDEVISRELIIDHAPPVIRILSQKSTAVEFTVSDDLSGLASVTVSTNGKDYKAVPPVEGILDSGTKRFVAKITPGQVLLIRAEDSAGNVAGAQAGG